MPKWTQNNQNPAFATSMRSFCDCFAGNKVVQYNVKSLPFRRETYGIVTNSRRSSLLLRQNPTVYWAAPVFRQKRCHPYSFFLNSNKQWYYYNFLFALQFTTSPKWVAVFLIKRAIQVYGYLWEPHSTTFIKINAQRNKNVIQEILHRMLNEINDSQGNTSQQS